MAGPFGRDHDHIQIFARRHHTVVNIEAVRKGKRGTFFDVRRNFSFVDVADVFIGQ